MLTSSSCSASALKLDHASALREGREAPLTAAGQHVGLFWESPRNAWGHWDYIDLGVSDEVAPWVCAEVDSGLDIDPEVNDALIKLIDGI